MNASDLSTLDLPTAVEDLAAPAYVISREGRFSWVNRAMVELLGDLRGEPFIEYVAPEHRQLARTNFTRKVVGKTTRIFEMVVLDRNGGRIPMRLTSAPLRRDGHIVGIFGVGMPLAQAPSFKHSPLEDLTPRQQEVLCLLGEGLETPAIDEGPHKSYALQWFSFALIFLVGWITLMLRRGEIRRVQRVEP